jgi:hypothetical protein
MALPDHPTSNEWPAAPDLAGVSRLSSSVGRIAMASALHAATSEPAIRTHREQPLGARLA